MEIRIALGVCVALFGLVAGVRAHDPGISTAQVVLLADRITITTGFAPDDAKHFVAPELRGEEKWTDEDFLRVREPLTIGAPGLWEVEVGGRRLAPRDANVELLPGDNVSFTLIVPRPPGLEGALRLRALRIGELPAGHRQFVIVADDRGSTVAKKLLSAADPALEVGDSRSSTPSPQTPAKPDGAGTFWDFLRLGVEHIWTGYDHLLFLFALLVVCSTFRSIVAIVSCFTVAHSVTLAFATLNWVSLPASWVEPVIAASIVFVAAENLLRRGKEPRGRGLLTFGFGLIHGFGFASVLRDLGVGRAGTEGVFMPLLSFNLGVELGQIVIAAVVLPLFWQIRKRPRIARWAVTAVSVIVGLAGLFWLCQRTIFA